MIRDLFRKAAKIFWLLPGFLLWASFPPMGETTDCLFALAPLLWLSRNADVKTNVRRWFTNGLIFWVATLSWMPAIVKNGGPWPLVVLGWGLLAAYCSLYFGAFGFLSARYWGWARVRGGYGRRLLGILFVEPVLWAGLEIVRSRFGGGFAWNHLGVAPVNCGFGAPAALGGVYAISALVILVNGTLASIAERMFAPYFANRRRKIEVGGRVVVAAPSKPAFSVPNWVRSVETLLPFLVVIGVYQLAGRVVVREPTPDDKVPRLGVAMIQRDFPCCFQGREENPYEIYDKLLENVALLKPDLVVLPESAMCEFGPTDQQGAFRFAEWLLEKSGARFVLAGGSRHGDGTEYNSAALYGRESVLSRDIRYDVYDKAHLVPFGEFIPGDKWIPALQKLAPVGSCTPGELKLLALSASTSNVNLGVAICFEDTDSAQMRELAKMGAEVLLFITNDSWFSHSIEGIQHAWQARVRAIETGLPIVRVGNSGVSGTIRPDGKTTWLVGADGKPLVDARGTMFDRVAPAHSTRRTPYVYLGDRPLGSAFALLLLGMLFSRGRMKSCAAEKRDMTPDECTIHWRRHCRRKAIKHALEAPFAWLGIGLGILLFRCLTHRALVGVCDVLSAAFYRFDRRGRRRALETLRIVRGACKGTEGTQAFDPDLSPFDPTVREAAILRRSYRNMARTIGHIFWTCSGDAKRIPRAGELSTAAREFLCANHPAVTVSAHIGCWEILSQLAFLEGHRMMSVAKRIGSGRMTKMLMKSRRSIGQEIVEASGAMKFLMKGIAEGKSLGLLVDQSVDPNDGGLWVRFLGRPMPVSAAPAFFAAKAKAPIAVAWSRPLRDGRYRCEVVDVIPAAEARDIWKTTQRCASDIERIVRRHPSCWVMNYNFFSNIPTEQDLAALAVREAKVTSVS